MLEQSDTAYLLRVLEELLEVPSPVGCTDEVAEYVAGRAAELGLACERTRRGGLRVALGASAARATIAHLDTLGAMVSSIDDRGRLGIAPLGTWSSRFAEGGRVTILTKSGRHRGTVLPRKASGHAFGDEVDEQPVSWRQVEVRVDATVASAPEIRALGIEIGAFVAFDSEFEYGPEGFINARHLDDKAGIAAILTAARIFCRESRDAPGCLLLFSTSEEVGTGAAGMIGPDIAELVAVDVAICALGQQSSEHRVTICRGDAAGPFDATLSDRLDELARERGVEPVADVFRHYRCDGASALVAGHDVRTALIGFGVDASHGYERTHVDSLEALVATLLAYWRADAGLS